MTVYCTFECYGQILGLAKNNSYSAIIDDLCGYFRDRDVAELNITRDIINSSGNAYSLNKFRIINSLSNKGKSSSYRCICACFPPRDFVVMGTVYPKTGADGFDNLAKEEYKNIAKNIKEAIASKQLYVLEISKKSFSKYTP